MLVDRYERTLYVVYIGLLRIVINTFAPCKLNCSVACGVLCGKSDEEVHSDISRERYRVTDNVRRVKLTDAVDDNKLKVLIIRCAVIVNLIFLSLRAIDRLDVVAVSERICCKFSYSTRDYYCLENSAASKCKWLNIYHAIQDLNTCKAAGLTKCSLSYKLNRARDGY